MVVDLFTKHPKSANETYWQHLKRAAMFSGWLLLGVIVCAVHAVFPFLFTQTASKIVSKLYTKH